MVKINDSAPVRLIQIRRVPLPTLFLRCFTLSLLEYLERFGVTILPHRLEVLTIQRFNDSADKKNDQRPNQTSVPGFFQIEGPHHSALRQLVARFTEPALHQCGHESVRAHLSGPARTGCFQMAGRYPW